MKAFNVISCERCKNGLCVSKVDLFKKLADDDLLKIVKMTSHRVYQKGETICHEGDTMTDMFIINEGRVKLSKYNMEGKEQILAILKDGETFNTFQLFIEDSEINFSAVALTETKVCVLSQDHMLDLLAKHVEISNSIIQSLATRLQTMENLVQNLSNVNTDARVAYVLVTLAKTYGEWQKDKVIINSPIHREDMANYAGLTRETMSRKLSALASEGIIETKGYKTIIICDMEKLENMI